MLGVAAGVLFGVSDIALKYLTGTVHQGVQGVINEWTAIADCRLGAGVLRLGSRPPARPRCSCHRIHVHRRQPCSDHGRDPRVPRPRRDRRAGDHRAHDRLRARDLRRRIDAGAPSSRAGDRHLAKSRRGVRARRARSRHHGAQLVGGAACELRGSAPCRSPTPSPTTFVLAGRRDRRTALSRILNFPASGYRGRVPARDMVEVREF